MISLNNLPQNCNPRTNSIITNSENISPPILSENASAQTHQPSSQLTQLLTKQPKCTDLKNRSPIFRTVSETLQTAPPDPQTTQIQPENLFHLATPNKIKNQIPLFFPNPSKLKNRSRFCFFLTKKFVIFSLSQQPFNSQTQLNCYSLTSPADSNHPFILCQQFSMSFNIEDYPDMDPTSFSLSRKAPAKGRFAPTTIPQLTRVEAELYLRSLSCLATCGYKISNIPKDAQSIHRAVNYFHETHGYPKCDLPFQPEDDLDADVYKWAHSSSSRNRPALVLFSDLPINFTASGTDPTGRDLALIDGERPHPVYSEHRVTLHQQMVQPRPKSVYSSHSQDQPGPPPGLPHPSD